MGSTGRLIGVATVFTHSLDLAATHHPVTTTRDPKPKRIPLELNTIEIVFSYAAAAVYITFIPQRNGSDALNVTYPQLDCIILLHTPKYDQSASYVFTPYGPRSAETAAAADAQVQPRMMLAWADTDQKPGRRRWSCVYLSLSIECILLSDTDIQF